MQDIQVRKDIFLSDLGCIYLSDIKTIVVSDLHLGFEAEMNLHGLFLPHMQRDHVESAIDKMLERYSPENIVINGDFKHEFSKNLSQEWDDIIHFIDRYQNETDLTFVRGQPAGDCNADCPRIVLEGHPVLDGAFAIRNNTDQFCASIIL